MLGSSSWVLTLRWTSQREFLWDCTEGIFSGYPEKSKHRIREKFGSFHLWKSLTWPFRRIYESIYEEIHSMVEKSLAQARQYLSPSPDPNIMDLSITLQRMNWWSLVSWCSEHRSHLRWEWVWSLSQESHQPQRQCSMAPPADISKSKAFWTRNHLNLSERFS